MTTSRRLSHRHHSALSAVPSLTLSDSTSRASSVFSTTETNPNQSSSPLSHSRHHSIEKSQSPTTALDHHLACSSSFLALANGGRMTPALLSPSQRWDDSQLALDLADDTLLHPNTSMSSSSSRHTLKMKMRQWIKTQRLTQWLSDRKP